MKPKVTYATLILMLGLLLCGAVLPACGHRDDKADLGPLPEIERMLHSPLVVNPDLDSAVAMMAGLRAEQFESPRARALYDLMCKEVDYKLFRETPDDSTLLVAAECFRKEGDRRRLMRTLFQIGRTRLIGEDYRGSLRAALEAMDLAQELGDVLYLAKTNELCGDNFNHVFNFVESANYCRRAAEYYDRYGWKENAMVSYADVSSNIYNLQRYEDALIITDSVLANPGSSDPGVLAYVYESRIRPNWRLGRVQEARANLDSAIKYDPSARYRNHLNPVIVAIAENDTEAARLEISELKNGKYSDIDETDILYLEYMLYSKTGEKDKAVEAQRVLRDKETDAMMKICRNSPELSNYLNSEKEEKIDTLIGSVSKYRWQIALMWIAALIFLGISVALYRRWAKKGQGLTRSLEEKSQAIAELIGGRMARVHADKTAIINEICDKYFAEKDSKDAYHRQLYQEVCNKLRKLNEGESMAETVKFLNETKGDIVDKLDALPGLNSSARLVAIYSMLGLTPKAISIICSLSYQNVYTLRSRLKAQIEASDLPFKAELLAAIKGK